MSNPPIARLKYLFNQLEDRPLEPDDPFYVNYLEKQPEHDSIHELATRISWSEAASVNLLSGQRGSGKSTELRRLRKYLQEEEGCIVLLCDMRDYLNLTKPIEITDFLISLMVALNEAVREKYKNSFTKENYWDRLINFLNTEVKIKDLTLEGELPGGKIGISASLKDDPSFKSRLQEHLRGHVYKLVRQAHQFAGEIVQFIRQQENNPNQKVVLLSDSMEQIRGMGSEANKVYETVADLFCAHADNLHIPLLHVVYTVPPYLNAIAPNLGQILGGNSIANLPSVHIRNRDGKRDNKGLSILRDIIRHRCHDYESIFEGRQIDRMAESTGGDFRNFFRLLRDCLTKAAISANSFPIADTIVDDAENHLRRDMLPIAEDDKLWLRKIAKSQKTELLSSEKLPQLARFFDTHVVLNYRNTEDWYYIHPLLEREIAA
jgi:energy-coupling factor transporter ATP-binding protein EcfA2